MDQVKEFYITHKFLLWPILALLLSMIIMAWVIVPQMLTYFNVRKQISDLQTHTSSLEAKAKELEGIDQDRNQKNLQVVFTVLPKDPDVPIAVSNLQDLVTRSGLTLKGVSYTSSGSESGSKSFHFDVEVIGQISQVRTFFISLQSAQLIYQIESVNVHFQLGSLNVQAQMPISVFYQPIATATASLDQPVPKLDDQEKNLLAKLSQVVPQAVTSELNPSGLPSVPLGKSDPFQ